jgi:hypothetical protein
MTPQTGVTCPCSNISIKAQVLPAGVYPNIPPSERARLQACLAVWSIGVCSIRVQDFGFVSVHSNSTRCTDVVCKRCSHVLRFFVGKFFQFVGRCPPNFECRHRTCQIPGSLQPFFVRTSDELGIGSIPVTQFVHEDLEPLDLDFEFDLMFTFHDSPVSRLFAPGPCPRLTIAASCPEPTSAAC